MLTEDPLTQVEAPATKPNRWSWERPERLAVTQLKFTWERRGGSLTTVEWSRPLSTGWDLHSFILVFQSHVSNLQRDTRYRPIPEKCPAIGEARTRDSWIAYSSYLPIELSWSIYSYGIWIHDIKSGFQFFMGFLTASLRNLFLQFQFTFYPEM